MLSPPDPVTRLNISHFHRLDVKQEGVPMRARYNRIKQTELMYNRKHYYEKTKHSQHTSCSINRQKYSNLYSDIYSCVYLSRNISWNMEEKLLPSKFENFETSIKAIITGLDMKRIGNCYNTLQNKTI